MQKSKSKPLVVVLKKPQPATTERNIMCTCGKVYRNPAYTFQYATCPRHSPKQASQ